MNPKQSCLSHCDFFEWTAFSDKRFDKIAGNKSGAAVSPLGGLHRHDYIREPFVKGFWAVVVFLWLLIEDPKGGDRRPTFILGDFVEAFVGERCPFEEGAM